MQFKENESVIKVFHHHPFPFVVRAFKILMVSLPFFLVATFFRDVLSLAQMAAVYVSIAVIFILIVLHEGVRNYLNRIEISNERVIYINWKNVFTVEEVDVKFKDIENIETIENGILARIKLFDYGTFRVETTSGDAAILFLNANDPEGMRDFIYHLYQKPSKIVHASIVRETSASSAGAHGSTKNFSAYDRERESTEKIETGFTGIED